MSRGERVSIVTQTPGLIAFWDFVNRENDGEKRFTAYVPPMTSTDYPLDAGNYVREYWGQGRSVSYDDFPLLGRGPFGQAIKIRYEEDPTLRPYLLVPRSRLHDTPLDIKGGDKSVTVVVWAIRESGNHALAGIWHEGTDLKQDSTIGIQRVVRGQRQYALFAGLAKPGSACGHISDNGASSFTYKYAVHKCHSLEIAPGSPSDASAQELNVAWSCFAMTYDHESDELTGWLDGVASPRWEENLDSDMMAAVRNAWRQGHWASQSGLQDGEDPEYPKDQYYNPPEENPVKTTVLSMTQNERVELLEYRYTKVRARLRKIATGEFRLENKDLVAVRLNPWWFPHEIYTPKDDGSGGPFTIGRVIHSARSSGYSGWIGGVAVFDRALSSAELAKLASIDDESPILHSQIED